MSEIATRDTTGLDTSPATILSSPTAGTVQLAEWAQELDAAHRLGTALCQTDFVPKDFRGKPEAAAAAILAGKALGLDPMNSLSNIFVVHGRPALYARTMVAIVLSAGHQLVRAEATDKSVTVQARRRGDSEWQEFTWTIDRAKKAGYTSNAKYQTDPIAMLTAKAQAEACRTIAPDVLTGVAAYAVEEVELEDMGERPSRPARTPRAVEAAPAQEAVDAPATITQDQWNDLKKAGAAAGKDAKEMGALAAEVTGIKLTAWKDIPADRYDDILQAVSDIVLASQSEDEEGVA
ncbi:hypothetical protein [Citricoccus sp. NR2]|uniref:hypothetical protein n=1 Tax=Citricoccus sp. NR2 TaxID=3004095 RepID=UPI0022DD4EE2|nr:hypothetical protein [Citricoccus sp. NR2]WBL18479.1 hypothetical protein O1A05_12025 [Citricoccus sp. NR2]